VTPTVCKVCSKLQHTRTVNFEHVYMLDIRQSGRHGPPVQSPNTAHPLRPCSAHPRDATPCASASPSAPRHRRPHVLPPASHPRHASTDRPAARSATRQQVQVAHGQYESPPRIASYRHSITPDHSSTCTCGVLCGRAVWPPSFQVMGALHCDAVSLHPRHPRRQRVQVEAAAQVQRVQVDQVGAERLVQVGQADAVGEV